MVLITSVASVIIWFKPGYLINTSVWSSAFFAINIVQAREAKREISLYCIQLAAIKAKPSKWSLFNIQLISSTVRYWQDLLGLLVQFARLLAKGLLWCSVNPFNPVLAGRLCPMRSWKQFPTHQLLFPTPWLSTKLTMGIKPKCIFSSSYVREWGWQHALNICVRTCLER